MTAVPFLDLRRQVTALRRELDEAIAAILDTGRFVLGPHVERFEQAFANYCGARHAVGVASGTDAISLALRAVGIEAGDEVITVANTCVPTVVGIERAGAVPVLVDADPVTWTLDPERLEGALGRRTRAIIPVHLYGRCAAMDEILEFAWRHGLRVVEDAAQAHGAECRAGRPGAISDAAAFSFYPTKNLGALGDAGAVVTQSAEVADRVRKLRSYGEKRRYESVAVGMNSRLDELQAAVLLVKLAHIDAWVERRGAIARRYREAFADAGLGLPVEATGGRHAYHQFVITSTERETLRRRLVDAGIQTLVHYPRAVHEHRAYRRLGHDRNLETSERLAREVVSLPIFPELTDGEVDAVVSGVLLATCAAT